MPITPRRIPPATSERGFTLVVIAALFVAFAVIAAVAVERNTVVQSISKRDETAAKLSRLANAILEYSVFNKNNNTLLYPCPALYNLAVTDANFGKQVVTSTTVPGYPYTQDCSNISGDTATATMTGLDVLGGSGNPTIRGMVPVQDLSAYGISVNDAFDSWNNRIMYIVNRNLTKGSSGTPNIILTLTDQSTGLARSNPDFILISYGKDGAGGYKRDGALGAVSVPCPAAGSNRAQNCLFTITFYTMPTYTAADANATTYFDDILTYFRQ